VRRDPWGNARGEADRVLSTLVGKKGAFKETGGRFLQRLAKGRGKELIPGGPFNPSGGKEMTNWAFTREQGNGPGGHGEKKKRSATLKKRGKKGSICGGRGGTRIQERKTAPKLVLILDGGQGKGETNSGTERAQGGGGKNGQR